MNQRVKHAWGPLFFVGALSAAVGLQGSALAQEAGDPGAELEEIVVTGSYLFTGLDSPSPVQVITGEEMVSAAPTDLATYFFDNVTQNVSSDPTSQTVAAGMSRDRAIRTANVDLRGIGGENTLVLLNGQRTITNPAPEFSGFRLTNINSLVPRIAIARTELLLDGGSALYGSDAVAGVINTITRNNFEGFDFSVDSRFFEEATSAKDVTIAALWGAGNETSHVIAAIEWHESDRVRLDVVSGDDDPNPNVDPITGIGLVDQQFSDFSSAGRGASTWIDPDCGNPAFGAPVIAQYPSYSAAGEVYLSPNPFTGATGSGPAPTTPATLCSRPQGFSVNEQIQNDQENLLIFVAGEHHFSDRLTATVEMNFNRQRFNDEEIWGDGGGQSWVPSTPARSGTDFAIPVTHPGRIHAVGVDPSFGLGPGGPATIYSPGETLPFLGTADAFQDSDIWRAQFGLEGEINSDWSWNFKAGAAYSEVRNAIRDIITRRYPAAINGLGGPLCDPADVSDPTSAANDPFRGTGDCFYYNPFMNAGLPNAASLQTGLSQTGLAVDPVMMDWLSPLRTDVFDAEFYSAEAQVTGFFGNLPGGPIGLAAGVAFRSDSGGRDTAQSANAGETATLGTVGDYTGRQTVDSLYFEFALPLTDSFSVQVAARYEDYDGFDNTSPKIAALWTPTDDLILRASWGQSFKAPGIVHLASSTIFNGAAGPNVTIGGVSYGTPGCGRPCAIRGAYRIDANPDLLAQESDNWSVGFDYSITDNISFGVSYIGIDFTGRIVNPNMPSIVGRDTCFLTDANGIPITEAPGGGPGGLTDPLTYNALSSGSPDACVILVDPALAPTFDNVALIFATPINADFLNVEAVDLRANMFWDVGIGMLSFTPNVSVFTKYDYPGAVSEQCPGGICDGIARTTPRGASGVRPIPRWQGTFAAGLIMGDHNLRLTPRYTDGVNDEVGDLNNADAATFDHEEGLWTVDLNWSWQFTASSSISASARNLFAQDPPEQEGAIFNRQRRTYSIQYLHSFGN